MDESEDTMSSDDSKNAHNPSAVKKPPRKRSLVERELETNLTARVTSPVTNGDGTSTSRYGRSRRLKKDMDFCDTDKAVAKVLKSPSFDKTPVKPPALSPVYRMHASNSPVRTESPKKVVSLDINLENQIENIYNANISLSRFGAEEKKLSQTPVMKFPKVYIRKDLIQTKEKDETGTLIDNMFSPIKTYKQTNSHLNNILERSSEKYTLNGNVTSNGYIDTSSVVKALDFDSSKKKKKDKDSKTLSKSDLFEMEAKCEYQVGDLAWARMGTYPFWPCIVTREPGSEIFVKKKLFGRIERDIIHVTFFGDNGRRSWLVDTMLRKFQGLVEFEATRDQFPPEAKKKDPRLYSAFFISEKKQGLWKTSVDEAETLLREPKRLRIDLLTVLLEKSRATKVTPKPQKSGKVRSDNDVPLSESLYDTLFSEDDGKSDDSERSRNKSRNKSLDVSEVVTACLDNMAAKTGMIQIQKQSHMDRWLQKAKSKTPEKLKVSVTQEKIEKEAKDKVKGKESKATDPKKKKFTKKTPAQKPYHFRRSVNESQTLRPYHNEHDYSIKSFADMEKCFVKINKNDIVPEKTKDKKTEAEENSDQLCVVVKVETLDKSEDEKVDNDEAINGESIDCTELKKSNENIPDNGINEMKFLPEKESMAISSREIEVDLPSLCNKESTKHNSEETTLETFKINYQINNQNDTEILEDNILETTEVNDTIKILLTNKTIGNNDIDNMITPDCGNMPKSDLHDKSLVKICTPSIDIDIQTLPTDQPDKSSLEVVSNSDQNNTTSDAMDINGIESGAISNVNNDVIVEKVCEDSSESSFKVDDKLPEDRIQIGSIECVIEHITSEDEVSNSNDIINDDNKMVDDFNKDLTIKEQTNHNKGTENSHTIGEVTGTSQNRVESEKIKNETVLNDAQEINHNKPEVDEQQMLNEDIPVTKIDEEILHIVEGRMQDNTFDIELKNGDKSSINVEVISKNDIVQDMGTEEDVSKTNLPQIMPISHMDCREDATISAQKDDIQDNLPEITSISPMESTKHVIVPTEQDARQDNLSETMSVSPLESQVNTIVSSEENKSQNNLPEITSNSFIESSKDVIISTEKDVMQDNLPDIMLISPIEPTKDVIVSTKYDAMEDYTPETMSVSPLESILNTIASSEDNKSQDNLPEITSDSLKESSKNVIISTEKVVMQDNLPDMMSISPIEPTKDVIVSTEHDAMQDNIPETMSLSPLESKLNTVASSEENKSQDNLPEITSDSLIESSKDIIISTEKDVMQDNLPEMTSISPIKSAKDVIVSTEHDSMQDNLPETMSASPLESKLNTIASSEENKSQDNLPNITSNSLIESSKGVIVSTEQNVIQDNLPEAVSVYPLESVENTVAFSEENKSQDNLPPTKSISPIQSTVDTRKHNARQVNQSEIMQISPIESDKVVFANKDASQDNLPKIMSISAIESTEAAIVSNEDVSQDNLPEEMLIPDIESQEDAIVSTKKYTYRGNLPEKTLTSSKFEAKNISAVNDASQDNLPKITSVSSIECTKETISTKEIIGNEINSFVPTLLPNETCSPILENGLHDEANIKFENLFDSETESIASELDDISLSELKLRSQTRIVNSPIDNIGKAKNSQNNVPIIKRESDTSQIDIIETNLPKIVDIRSVNNEVAIHEFKSENIISKKKLQICLKRAELPTNKKDEIPNKDIDKYDADTASIKSADSVVSTKRKRKDKTEKVDNLRDPEFLRYLELRQDSLIEEHPELTIEEIVSYLYKTWLYENSMKSDQKKSDDIEQSNLVKGQEPTKPIKSRKVKNKLINIEKVLSQDSKKSVVIKETKEIKNNPKRKTSQLNYNEDYPDIEDEIQMFEIFNSKPKGPKIASPITESKSERKYVAKADADTHSTQLTNKETSEIETIDLDDYDEVETYFKQLTKPKPNIFRGLVREKVCDICEIGNNLIKCKGCHGMFHLDCVKKQMQTVEVRMPTKGRKKKKKPRGRKPKVSTDSNGVDSDSQSDDKSQDLSEDFNISNEDLESEHIVADADIFETQFSTKMNELLATAEKIDYDSYSTDEELDWKGVKAGKCKIADITLKPRSKPIDVDFKCHNCLKYDQPICFLCKSIESPKGHNLQRQKCQIAHCHKYYHLGCLEQWPQTQFNSGEPSRNNKKINEFFEAMSCPRHVCHTCVCDDPRGCKTRFSGDKLARCVRCPATYHSFTKCLPAGTQILTASQIICPRHYQHRPGKVPCHVNTGWCFICALGGSLICCEYCPTSFHAECLNIKPPEGGYMCEDCETGRLPLYGEMVWVKLGHYRWWPGMILHPSEIPANIMAVKHSLGEFVVRFFGQYDHYWVNRGRVFPFQEGDTGKVSGQKSKIDEAFTVAMEHAQRAFTLMKNMEANEEESLDIASSLLPPHYVKLKVNKPCGSLCGRRIDIEESSLTQCECNPDEEEPCGLYSHCLNRMLLTECGPSCRAGDRCNNRAFEKRQYPKLVPYRTPHRGWGLKTLEDIKAGQFVIEYVGELIDEEEFQRRMRRKHEIRDENFYFLTLDKERMIDAGPKGNSARFMNHCCEPNCETQKWTVLGDVRVGLFAINDIPANSEVTFNYNLECAGIEKKRCLCGAKRCSGYIGAKPKQDESQAKKGKIPAKRVNKKRKNAEESPSTSQTKPKRPVGRPAKPRELTEIEKDLLIIKNATNGISSDSECSRLSSLEGDAKGLKRKRGSFSEEYDSNSSPSVKRLKIDEGKSEVGD